MVSRGTFPVSISQSLSQRQKELFVTATAPTRTPAASLVLPRALSFLRRHEARASRVRMNKTLNIPKIHLGREASGNPSLSSQANPNILQPPLTSLNLPRKVLKPVPSPVFPFRHSPPPSSALPKNLSSTTPSASSSPSSSLTKPAAQ